MILSFLFLSYSHIPDPQLPHLNNPLKGKFFPIYMSVLPDQLLLVKFSYHPDGFVQFSSTTNSRIMSGRNPDGTPKGLDLVSWPLSNPISIGPSMTITFWGLTKFEKELPIKVDKRFVFETKKAIPHPKAKFKNGDELAYAMAFYIVPNSIQRDIKKILRVKNLHI